MTLLNELTAVEADIVLILDDYHAIATQAIHDGIGFLLSHLPPQVHLIIASRADPPLSLARLRSYKELTELRVSDLRFTPDQAVVDPGNGIEDFGSRSFRLGAANRRLDCRAATRWRYPYKGVAGDRRFCGGFFGETIATLWTICWKKSCSGSRTLSVTFCCKQPFW